MQNRFLVIVPVYNAVDYIVKCLDSIICQDYKHFKVVVIDDHSTDGTWDLICTYPFYKYRNDTRNESGLANIVKGIEYSNKNNIIVTIDGDDWLADNTVLSYLNEIYTDDIWLTYGQFVPVSGRYKDFCKPIALQDYRQTGEWVTSHLRTFRRSLWNKIDDNDLRENGEYFKVGWDLAFMFPMIEMAGSHIRFIDKVLYIYNDQNPTNDFRVNADESIRIATYIRSKPSYKEL
jgi:glycosyltransferase involved in cell wall biosynthesis